MEATTSASVFDGSSKQRTTTGAPRRWARDAPIFSFSRSQYSRSWRFEPGKETIKTFGASVATAQNVAACVGKMQPSPRVASSQAAASSCEERANQGAAATDSRDDSPFGSRFDVGVAFRLFSLRQFGRGGRGRPTIDGAWKERGGSAKRDEVAGDAEIFGRTGVGNASETSTSVSNAPDSARK